MLLQKAYGHGSVEEVIKLYRCGCGAVDQETQSQKGAYSLGRG